MDLLTDVSSCVNTLPIAGLDASLLILNGLVKSDRERSG